VADGRFVDCDPQLLAFAVLGAVSLLSRWFDPVGARSGREIAETSSADPIAPAAG